jgi:hypothetical protein
MPKALAGLLGVLGIVVAHFWPSLQGINGSLSARPLTSYSSYNQQAIPKLL